MPTHWTHQNLLDDGVEYVHADYKGNLERVLAHINPEGKASFEGWKLVGWIRDLKTHCACTHEIFVQNHIVGPNGDSLVVGSKCIHRFGKSPLSDAVKRAASKRARDAKHPNRVVCEHCHKTVSLKPTRLPNGQLKTSHIKCTEEALAKAMLLERQGNMALAWTFKYGAHQGSSIRRLLETAEGLSYLKWMKKNSKSPGMADRISIAAERLRAEILASRNGPTHTK